MKMLTYRGEEYEERPQLFMRFPTGGSPERSPEENADGYRVRCYEDGDRERFFKLMEFGDFDPWDDEKWDYNLGRALPGGFFFAVDEKTDSPIATIVCLHNYSGRIPFCGEIGWTVCHPDLRGKGIGQQLTTRATNRFVDAGYTDIHLRTEYFRLPAIKTYLRSGYLPVMDCEETNEMWRDACEKLSWAFTPEDWPTT